MVICGILSITVAGSRNAAELADTRNSRYKSSYKSISSGYKYHEKYNLEALPTYKWRHHVPVSKNTPAP